MWFQRLIKWVTNKLFCVIWRVFRFEICGEKICWRGDVVKKRDRKVLKISGRRVIFESEKFDSLWPWDTMNWK